jgi:predicted aspartyl protease
MCRLFLDSVYLIFSDENDDFFLIKVLADNGKKFWHHVVDTGLSCYTINSKEVILQYIDEKIEVLNSSSGLPVR